MSEGGGKKKRGLTDSSDVAANWLHLTYSQSKVSWKLTTTESEGEDPVLACIHFWNLSLNSDQVDSCVFEEPQDRGITSSTKLVLDLLHPNQQQFTCLAYLNSMQIWIPWFYYFVIILSVFPRCAIFNNGKCCCRYTVNIPDKGTIKQYHTRYWHHYVQAEACSHTSHRGDIQYNNMTSSVILLFIQQF